MMNRVELIHGNFNANATVSTDLLSVDLRKCLAEIVVLCEEVNL